MIQYLKLLDNKEVKKSILTTIINNVKKDYILIGNHTICIKTVIKFDSHSYMVEMQITLRHVKTLLKRLRFCSYFTRKRWSNSYTKRYIHTTIYLLAFQPSRRDLYDILFKSNKRLYFIINSVNSKLLKYILNYKQKVTK